MRVRCGRCRVEFEVTAPGRYSCPACGAVNEVRAAPDALGQEPPMWAPPPPEPPAAPSPRIECPDCDFQFIVGDIEVALCPNCGAEVRVGPERGRASG